MSIKCPVCDTVCAPTSQACTTCGSVLPAMSPQSGFGQAPQSGFGQAPQSGFGQVPQSGFGQSPQSGFGQAPQSGFGQAPQSGFGQSPPSGFGQAPPSGFGQAQQSGFGQVGSSQDVGQSSVDFGGVGTGSNLFGDSNQVQDYGASSLGFGAPPQSGFGVAPPSGFGTPPKQQELGNSMSRPGFGANIRTGFGAPPSFDAPSPPQTHPQSVQESYTGQTADMAKFADTIGAALGSGDSVSWSFKDSLIFVLKNLIPIYGIVILVQALIGNPRKVPTSVTNYLRAALAVGAVLSVLMAILSVAFTSMVARLLMGM